MSIKKLIAIILSLVMATGSLGLAYADTQQTAASAKDYNGHWAESTIQKWIDEEKINGYPDGSFKPDNKITRAEFVQLVNNSLVDYTSQTATPFTDVKTGDWYVKAVNTAYATEYIKGYSQTQFAPTQNINREQAAAIMSRIQYLADNGAAVSAFTDSSKISTWAVGQVGAATNAEFVKGYDGKFNPLNNLTRAEAVTMLNNVLENGKNEVIYKAGTVLTDTTVEGDLIIAKTVGEGDVHLTNVVVKGSIKVYGGGVNSIYFNNVKVAKIEVEKDKVRLVLDDGTTVQEIAVGTEAILQNLGGTVAKVTIDSTGKVTLAGDFQDVQVISKTNLILDDAKITNLVVEQPISILGTGTIATLTANADGIQFDSTTKITKTELGTGVTEKPEIISGGGGGGGGPIGGGEETPTYKITFNYQENDADGTLLSSVTYPSFGTYTGTDKINEIVGQEIDSLIPVLRIANSYYTGKIEPYLAMFNLLNPAVQIGETDAYSEEGWNKVKTYLAGTEIVNGMTDTLRDQLLDGNVSIEDLIAILGLYDAPTIKSDLTIIDGYLKDADLSREVLITIGGEEILSGEFDVTQEYAEYSTFMLSNIDMTLAEFYDNGEADYNFEDFDSFSKSIEMVDVETGISEKVTILVEQQ